ncbi:thioredoxin [Granulicoccus phenolivorans]|uniref:thioredoxin n=1 Tax=Granulicoccus phenolivorans TaxID=266854 RepID=UPI0004087BDE|nr:thioredoxin [Granulicoccus phenolivorans]
MSAVVACPQCGAKNRVPAAASGLPRCAKCGHDLPWIAEADDADFAMVADSTKVPVLVDLWAPWCGPCRQISPALETIAHQRAGRLKLVKVNVDGSPGIQAQFGVQAIPTLVLFRGGREVARQTGALPPAHLNAWIDRSLA